MTRMTDSTLANPAPAAATGPDAAHWINRFARFTDEVADVRRDDETAPAPQPAPGAPRRHTYGTDLPAQPFPQPHWVATSEDCAALLGFPPDWAGRTDWNAIDVLTGRATWPG